MRQSVPWLSRLSTTRGGCWECQGRNSRCALESAGKSRTARSAMASVVLPRSFGPWSTLRPGPSSSWARSTARKWLTSRRRKRNSSLARQLVELVQGTPRELALGAVGPVLALAGAQPRRRRANHRWGARERALHVLRVQPQPRPVELQHADRAGRRGAAGELGHDPFELGKLRDPHPQLQHQAQHVLAEISGRERAQLLHTGAASFFPDPLRYRFGPHQRTAPTIARKIDHDSMAGVPLAKVAGLGRARVHRRGVA